MFYVRDRLMCYLVWPVCKRLPVRAYAWLSKIVSLPYGLLIALRERQHLREVSNLIHLSRPARLRLPFQMAYYRMRYLDYYLYERVPNLKIEWADNQPETSRCIYILANMRGSETISAFADLHPSIVVRIPFGSEGEVTVATAPKGFRWLAHMAEVRQAASRDRLVAAGQHPMQYRKLVNDPRNIIIYQDLWYPTGQHPRFTFLNQPVALNIGATRLSTMCGNLPIRFVSIRPVGNHWLVRVDPRFSGNDEHEIIRRVEAEILARPGAWEAWRQLLAYLKSS